MNIPHLVAVAGLLALAGSKRVAEPVSEVLPPYQQGLLTKWFTELGPPKDNEPFGSYLARAARLQHGVGYEVFTPPPGREPLQVRLDRFECVSFIESSLAVARCGWEGKADSKCFLSEIVASRYRGGKMDGYASRLHYFTEWIEDNASRDRLSDLTARLGGEPIQKRFEYISTRQLPRSNLPKDELHQLRDKLTSIEAQLSKDEHWVVFREEAPEALAKVKEGDLVAFVRERPGLLVHHAGFIMKAGGTDRLLHASSYHQRVVITVRDVTNYLLRRPERRAVIIARPLAPR